MWIVADLVYDTDAEAREAERLAREGKLTGVSVDMAVVDAEIEIRETDQDGFPTDWLETVTRAEIIGATQVPMPAFADAHIEFTDGGAQVWLAPEGIETSDRRMISQGALEWRDPAPFMFIDRTTPGHDDAVFVGNLTNFRRVGSLVADNPGLWGLTKPQIKDGQIVGHGAGWGTCHTAFRNACVTAPSCEYALVSDGVPIYRHPDGDIHAPLSLDWKEALAWYEANCERVGTADVGEDGFGIWVNGNTSLDDGEVFLSGDWRGEGLELISFLVVDNPGFPTALVAASTQVALVGAGIVRESKPPSLEDRLARLEVRSAAQDLLDALA